MKLLTWNLPIFEEFFKLYLERESSKPENGIYFEISRQIGDYFVVIKTLKHAYGNETTDIIWEAYLAAGKSFCPSEVKNRIEKTFTVNKTDLETYKAELKLWYEAIIKDLKIAWPKFVKTNYYFTEEPESLISDQTLFRPISEVSSVFMDDYVVGLDLATKEDTWVLTREKN